MSNTSEITTAVNSCNIAFAGQPNSGKSTLFNMMTGARQHVANYPGITVEKKTGEYTYNGSEVCITDLPGTYSLTSYSPEERVSRDFILNEKPEVIVNIADGSNLERQLYLTFQILEMGRPVVMYLNKMDVAESSGLLVDSKLLEKELGIPVISGSAKKKQYIDDLKNVIRDVYRKNIDINPYQLDYSERMEPQIRKIEAALEGNERIDRDLPLKWLAVKLIEHDEKVIKEQRENFSDFDSILSLVDKLEEEHKKEHGHSFEIEIALARSFAAKRIVKKCVKKIELDDQSIEKNRTREKAFLSIGMGILCFVSVFILNSIVDSVFGFLRNFSFSWIAVFDNPGNYNLFRWFFSSFFSVLFTYGALKIYREGLSVNRTDRVDQVLCHRVYGPLILLELILVFYWITVILGYRMTDKVFPVFQFFRSVVSQLIPPDGIVEGGLLRGLLLNGVIDGAIMILNYLPIFLCLFALVAFLEDVGYMARIAFIMDRILRKFGLHGQSTLPMILSGVIMGGCVVPGVMSTRTIRDNKSRLVTILILPLLNCMAKIPFYVLITSIFFVNSQWLILGGLSFFTLITALLVAKFLSTYVIHGEVEPFVLELPSFNLPTLSGIVVRTWERLWHFIQKVVTIVIAVSVVIWAGITFPGISSEAESRYFTEQERKIEEFGIKLSNPYTKYIASEKQLVDYMQFEEKYKIASAMNLLKSEKVRKQINSRFFLENPEFAKIVLKGKIFLGENMPLFESYLESYEKDFDMFKESYSNASESSRDLVKSDFYTKWMKANPYFFAIVRTGDLKIKGDTVLDSDAKKTAKVLRSVNADLKLLRREYKKEILESSVLGRTGKFFEPVSRLAGFDWRVNVAVLGAFAAKEALVSTLGTIYSVESGSGDDGSQLEERIKGGETGLSALDGLVIMLLIALFPPCVAVMMTIKSETGSWLWMAFSVVYPVALGGIIAVIVYQVGTLLGF